MDTGPWIERLAGALKQAGAIRTPAVEAAFRNVPRHRFIETFYMRESQGENIIPDANTDWTAVRVDPANPEAEQLDRIYSSAALPTRLTDGRPTSATSEPALMAYMLEELQVAPGMRVLEIGAGTGYNAALLAELVGEGGRVTSIDVQPDVAEQARRLLAGWRPGAATVLAQDGFAGAPEAAPFDRVVATVGCPDLSPRWVEQLRPAGFMLLPLTHGGFCPLTRVWRDGERLLGRVIGFSGFMLMQGALAIDGMSHFGRFRPPAAGDASAQGRMLPALAGVVPLPDERSNAASSSSRGFWYFLALRDARPFNAVGPCTTGYGLHDDALGDVFVDTQGGRVVLDGDDALYQQLLALHAEWQAAGSPGLDDYRLEFTPRAQREHGPRPAGWQVERRFFDQWVTVA
ncbi:MAG TPA: methyltransferase domain-containing protein [Dehalococcoidia bacterium]|nr:methyltransferase domain-containing protein [Dehalococcoidia bacterium]